jgi:hypothetical protein
MPTSPDLVTIRLIVDAAVRAPSVHNSQPWLWEYDGERLHLMADWSRQLRYADPEGRDLLISCGAALHHAGVASAAFGWSATVQRLPDRPDERRLATISFTPSATNAVHQAALQALHQRRTDRRTPSSQPIPSEKLDALVRAATIHGAFATLLPDEASDQLRDLMMLSSVLQQSSDAYLDELAHWTHSTGDDGVPDSSVVWNPGRYIQGGAGSRFPNGRLLDHEPEGKPRQAWILLTTSSDDTICRLRAGEALSAVLVMAMLQGLSVVPYTQPIEVDTTRKGVENALLRGSSNLQVILRVAVPPEEAPTVRQTRRRPVDAVLKTQSSDQTDETDELEPARAESQAE